MAWPQVRKPTVALAVAAAHALLLVLIWSQERPLPQSAGIRGPEIVFVQIASPKPHRGKQRSEPPRSQGKRHTLQRARAPFAFTLPGKNPSAPVLHGLFGCTPENLDKLTDEERAQCRNSTGAFAPYNPNSVDYADRTNRSRDAKKWARAVARKNAPTLLPCASPEAVGVGIGTIICLANGVIDGFDLENKAEYFDKPEDVHVPNNGDPARPNSPLD